MKKSFAITSYGAVLLGGAVALLCSGIALSNGVFFFLGACCWVGMGLARLLARQNMSQLKVEMDVPQQMMAGSSVEVEVTLKNEHAWWDIFQVEVVVILPSQVKCMSLASWLPAGSSVHWSEVLSFSHRGYFFKHEVRLLSRFPFGLFQVEKVFEIGHKMIITPRPILPKEIKFNGSLNDVEPRAGLTSGVSFGEPRGVRPWRAGDSARQIHWSSSARAMTRGHGLRVREFDPPGFFPERCVLVFHSYASGGEMLREGYFERAISLLVGTLLFLQKNGISVQCFADFNAWSEVSCFSRRQFIEFLGELAEVKRASGTEAHDIEAVLQNVPEESALVILSDMPPDSWQYLVDRYAQALVIDIRQIKYRKKSFLLKKE